MREKARVGDCCVRQPCLALQSPLFLVLSSPCGWVGSSLFVGALAPTEMILSQDQCDGRLIIKVRGELVGGFGFGTSDQRPALCSVLD